MFCHVVTGNFLSRDYDHTHRSIKKEKKEKLKICLSKRDVKIAILSHSHNSDLWLSHPARWLHSEVTAAHAVVRNPSTHSDDHSRLLVRQEILGAWEVRLGASVSGVVMTCLLLGSVCVCIIHVGWQQSDSQQSQTATATCASVRQSARAAQNAPFFRQRGAASPVKVSVFQVCLVRGSWASSPPPHQRLKNTRVGGRERGECGATSLSRCLQINVDRVCGRSCRSWSVWGCWALKVSVNHVSPLGKYVS